MAKDYDDKLSTFNSIFKDMSVSNKNTEDLLTELHTLRKENDNMKESHRNQNEAID
jgi:hypothetical protein